MCKCANFLALCTQPVNHIHTAHTHTDTEREMPINLLAMTYHSNLKGSNSVSSSSSQSILTKKVARSLGMQRIKELEFSLNVIFGVRKGIVFWPGGSKM